jgi:hypothetical protein
MKKWKSAQSESDEDLKSRWGQDIPVYDELDPEYIPISEDWIPIPIILDDKEYNKRQKIIEKELTEPFGVRAIPRIKKKAEIEIEQKDVQD